LAVTGSLYFDPVNLSLNQNEEKTVDVYVNAGGGELVGVDMILKYDPSLLSISDVSDGGAFSSSLKKTIDNSNGVAKVAFSNSYGNYTTGLRLLAKVAVKAKSTSNNTNLYFDFKKGSTTDTNVVDKESNDILESVTNMAVSISGGISGVLVTPTPANPGLTPTPAPKSGLHRAVERVLGKQTPSSENKGKGLVGRVRDFVQELKGDKNGKVLSASTESQLDPTRSGYSWYILIITIIILVCGIAFCVTLVKMAASARKKNKK